MRDFTYQNTARLIFGRNQNANIAEFIRPYSENVMVVHYGTDVMKSIGAYGIIEDLAANGLNVTEFGKIRPNPDVTIIEEAVKLAKEKEIGFVLAIGGGAVIDSAKAIAAGVFYDGEDLWDLFTQFLPIPEVLPVGAIATTPTTGSQSNASCVISNEVKHGKVIYGDPRLLPVFSVLDPSFFCTLPEIQLGYAACDIMSHIMEKYFMHDEHTDLMDGWMESTLRTVMRHARVLKKDINNYDSWAELAIAGNYGQNGLLGLGRDQDWSVHTIEHEVSAYYPVIHAAGVAVLTPAWMKFACAKNPSMFVQFAVNVMGVDTNLRDIEWVAREGIRRLEEFFEEMGLPRTMGDLGITDESLYRTMAEQAVAPEYYTDDTIGVYVKLNADDIVEIFRLAE